MQNVIKMLLVGFLNLQGFCYADGLGYASGLNGDDVGSATVLPQASPSKTVPKVSPLIVLPQESLEPGMLVVPLPGEERPGTVNRAVSTGVMTSHQPDLPKSSVKPGSQSANPASDRKPLEPITN